MSLDSSIGQRLRKRRNKLKLSLRELAGRTDLTASFLSQVERGQTNASLDSLRRIAEALDVSMLYFLSEDTDVHEQATVQLPDIAADTPMSSAAPTPPPGYMPVVRAGERSKIIFPDSGVTYELLVPSLTHKMEVICGHLSSGTENVVRRLRQPTEEFIYVLAGALQVGLTQGMYELHVGDTIYFEGSELQSLTAASEEEVVWLSVITPPVF